MQFARRYRQVRKLWSEGGGQEVLNRVRRAAAGRIAPALPPLPVKARDILSADLTKQKTWLWERPEHGKPLIFNWVTTPPARGSGGHTTMFRLIEYLERCGHQCRVYIYDVHGGDTSYFRSLVKGVFPRFAGPVEDAARGMRHAHAVVATSWQTAYPAYNDSCAGKRFYLVQDFEPWFYPAGGYNTLAENTYRMGFHAITAGEFLSQKLSSEFGMIADAFPFGCDTETYHIVNRGARDGVVFYAKPDAPRRAFEVGVLALEILVKRCPTLKIHFYGCDIGALPFDFINHGVLRPDQLNAIYNQCSAGLSLSMTNASLVPHEMLSAGCIPIVNEAAHNRIVLDNDFIRYAEPAPHALAAALEAVVKAGSEHSVIAASSVSGMSWDAAAGIAEKHFRNGLLR